MPSVDAGGAEAAPIALARDAQDVTAIVQEAAAQRRPLRIAAAGTWLSAGRPVAALRRLDLSSLAGVVEYVPGDLTITALAATPLAAIDEAVRANGQWLPLDAHGTRAGTIGATLATASAGPLAATVGLPRDVALGVAFVTGEGRLVRGGGRVVKNVAGFDLVRLVIGAWGTLGVLTEVTVRLRALPEADVTVALPIPSDAAALATMLATLRDAPIAPLALQLTVEGGGRLLARLAGNEDSVRAQREAISRLAPVEDADALAWTRLAQEHERFNVILRLSRRPTELARLWCMATGLAARFGGDVSATVGRGVVRCRLMVPDEASGELRAALDQRDPGDTVVVEVMPPAWWSFAPPSAVADPLSRSLRAAFDPAGVLNPGIIGAGA